MSRKMYQGGSSRKQAPMLTIREQDDEPPREAYVTTKKYTSMMIRVCHSRSHFLSCMYIHDDFMTESR